MERSRHEHWSGVAMLVGAAIVFSTAGFFTRLIALDAWTLLFWRSLFATLALGTALAVTLRRDTGAPWPRLGWPGLAIAAASAGGMVLYIQALRQTTVADVAVIYAAAPFVTALALWLCFGERPSPATLLASAAALVGVTVMIGGRIGGDLIGDALAFGMTGCMAAIMILVGRARATSMLAATALSALLNALATWPLAAPGLPTPAELVELALFGLQLAGGMLLLALGSRGVPASQSALIGTLDAPLAPLLVFVTFGERPDAATILGGTIVMAGVLAHTSTARPPDRVTPPEASATHAP